VSWRKATASNASGCVEVARTDEYVWVRDTKDRTLPAHGFYRFEWDAFVAGVKAGEFD
jgi:hypothetical protein